MQSIKNFARATGFAYLLLIPIGPFGIMYISSLIVEGDMGATMVNISNNETMFRWSMVAALITQLIHFSLVILLYKLLKPASEVAAKIMVALVMVGVPIAMLNEFSSGAILLNLNGNSPSADTVSLFLGIHEYGINIVQIFWGLWLFPFGYAVYKSTFLPKLIGVALMVGSFSYFIDSLVFIIDPTIEIKLAIFLFWGEILITFWLLFKGVNEEKWHEQNAR
ncbi:MAG: DUF4386 domain-containing protein [Hyphomicrobiales bacterium]